MVEYREGQTATNPKTGQKIIYQGGLWVAMKPAGPQPKAAPKLTEGQAKAAGQAVLMDQALGDYTAAQRDGYNPAGTRNVLARWVEGDEGGGFRGWAADLIRDDTSDRGRASELAYTEGALRALTGAAATPGEIRTTARNMFRQPGESDAVEPQKLATRQRFYDAVKQTAGEGYLDPKAPGSLVNPLRLNPGQSRNEIDLGAHYYDDQGNIRRNDNGDRGNPIVKKAAQPKPAASQPVRVRTIDEAMALAPGTVFITPDGRKKVR